jgi:hypothetical protein
VQLDPQCAEHALVDVSPVTGVRHRGIRESSGRNLARLDIDPEQVMVPRSVVPCRGAFC